MYTSKKVAKIAQIKRLFEAAQMGKNSDFEKDVVNCSGKIALGTGPTGKNSDFRDIYGGEQASMKARQAQLRKNCYYREPYDAAQ